MEKQKDGSYMANPNDQTTQDFLMKNFNIKVGCKERIGGAFYACDAHTAEEFADMVYSKCKWNRFDEEILEKINKYLKDNKVERFTASMVKK